MSHFDSTEKLAVPENCIHFRKGTTWAPRERKETVSIEFITTKRSLVSLPFIHSSAIIILLRPQKTNKQLCWQEQTQTMLNFFLPKTSTATSSSSGTFDSPKAPSSPPSPQKRLRSHSSADDCNNHAPTFQSLTRHDSLASVEAYSNFAVYNDQFL